MEKVNVKSVPNAALELSRVLDMKTPRGIFGGGNFFFLFFFYFDFYIIAEGSVGGGMKR